MRCWRAKGPDYCHLAADQVGNQCWESIPSTIRITILDPNVLALDKASFV
jgi:hypothetical protein